MSAALKFARQASFMSFKFKKLCYQNEAGRANLNADKKYLNCKKG